MGMRMNSPSSAVLPRLLSGTSCLRTPSRFVIHRSVQKKEFQPYCAGDSAGVSSVPAGESVVAAGASVAAGLVASVVAGGGVVGVGLVAGVTVSVFCSHAARSAAPAKMQMYFFIETHIALIDQSQQAQFLNRAECYWKHKWFATSTKTVPPISTHALQLPRRK